VCDAGNAIVRSNSTKFQVVISLFIGEKFERSLEIEYEVDVFGVRQINNHSFHFPSQIASHITSTHYTPPTGAGRNLPHQK
jgi:hypothetical protein